MGEVSVAITERLVETFNRFFTSGAVIWQKADRRLKASTEKGHTGEDSINVAHIRAEAITIRGANIENQKDKKARSIEQFIGRRRRWERKPTTTKTMIITFSNKSQNIVFDYNN